METFALLAQGFAVALTPDNIIWSIIGVTLGTAIGVLPGIGPATTVAILMPLTVGLPPVSAFIMFAGIYYGAQYGGSTASILLNTPGEPGAMMTAVDGNAMARRGRGAQALATAAPPPRDQRPPRQGPGEPLYRAPARRRRPRSAEWAGALPLRRSRTARRDRRHHRGGGPVRGRRDAPRR